MALEELGLEITTKGWAAFNSKMQAADKAIGKTADNWVTLGKSADKAARPLDTVAKRMQAAAKSAGDILTKLRPVGIALSAVAVAGAALIKSSTMVAARNEMLAVVLETVGRNAGYSERQLAQYEKSVKALGITTQSARQSLIQMAQADIDMAHATDLARLAQDAAVISQENSSVAFQKLITIIQTGNVLMGRRMGLTLDFSAANDRMADSLGISTDALTQEQRVQARLNEVMRQGVAIAGTYEAAMGTAGKAMTSLPRYWEEARDAIGQAFLPMLGQAVEALTDLLKWFNALSDSNKAFVSSMLGAGTVITGVAGALILLIPQVIAFTTAMAGAGIALLPVTLAILAVAAAMGVLFMAMKTSAEMHEQHAQASSAWAEMIEKEARTAKTATEVADAYLASLQRVTQEYNKAPALVRPFINLQGMVAESSREAKAAIEETAVSYEDYSRAMALLVAGTGAVIDEEGNLTQIWHRRGGQVEQLVEANYVLTESEWKLSQAVESTRPVVEMMERDMRGMADATVAAADAQSSLLGRIDELKESIAGAVGEENANYINSQEEIRAKMEEVREEIADLTGEQGYYTGSTEDLTIAQHKAEVATGKLTEAHQALAENTDPGRQLELEAAVAKSSIALDKANDAAGRASGGYVDNSERIGELRGDLGDLQGSLGDLAVAHREAMNQIIFDMMMARLATEGWEDAEIELAITIAESMGLIDDETAEAARAMNQALEDFATGEGVNQTTRAIMDIAARLAAIPTDISIEIRAHMVAADIGVAMPGVAARRQRGGPVRGGRPYWVGERGPEIFVPAVRGNIVSHSQSTTNQYNLTTQSSVRPGALAQEFGAMAFVGAGPSR